MHAATQHTYDAVRSSKHHKHDGDEPHDRPTFY